MVTRGDAEWSVYQGLRSLPRRPYLVAMWILGGELRTLYAPWNNDEKLLELMAATMDLVREAAISGESPDLARRALGLARAWAPVLRAAHRLGSKISGGLLNAWTLARFERILSGVSGHVSPEWDPARIRAAILGEPS